jgi:hypothetical protein
MVRPARTTPTVHETSTPDTQQPGSLGTNKRPLEDELDRIEVEKARLELDRQRKAAAFEEEQRAKQLAFDDERRAKELAFDEERRAQERELHQQKLARITSVDSSVTRHVDQDDDEGEIPPEAKEVSLLFPVASQKEIASIFEGKFDPVNLYKLRGRVSLSNVTGGKFRAKKRSGTVQDYCHSLQVRQIQWPHPSLDQFPSPYHGPIEVLLLGGGPYPSLNLPQREGDYGP